MQESVVYQELRAEAREEAYQAVRAELSAEMRQEARAEMRQELLDEGRCQEGRSLVLRQLGRRVGALPDAVRSRIEALSLTQLESLGEALLDFSSLPDLETWLASYPAA